MIGINSWGHSNEDAQNLNVALPINYVRGYLTPPLTNLKYNVDYDYIEDPWQRHYSKHLEECAEFNFSNESCSCFFKLKKEYFEHPSDIAYHDDFVNNVDNQCFEDKKGNNQETTTSNNKNLNSDFWSEEKKEEFITNCTGTEDGFSYDLCICTYNIISQYFKSPSLVNWEDETFLNEWSQCNEKEINNNSNVTYSTPDNSLTYFNGKDDLYSVVFNEDKWKIIEDWEAGLDGTLKYKGKNIYLVAESFDFSFPYDSQGILLLTQMFEELDYKDVSLIHKDIRNINGNSMLYAKFKSNNFLSSNAILYAYVYSSNDKTILNTVRCLENNYIEQDMLDLLNGIEVNDSTKSNNSIAEGCKKGDCSNGIGLYVYGTGDIYEGKYENDKRSGLGIYIWVDEWEGQVRLGEWENGIAYGYGITSYRSGEIDSGIWEDKELKKNLEKEEVISYLLNKYTNQTDHLLNKYSNEIRNYIKNDYNINEKTIITIDEIENSINKYLNENLNNLNDIEGIWTVNAKILDENKNIISESTGYAKCGIIKNDDKNSPYDFYEYTISADDFETGELTATFNKTNESRTYFSRQKDSKGEYTDSKFIYSNDTLRTNIIIEEDDEIFYYKQEYIKILPETNESIYGCMDPVALNYNPQANFNDNSCSYKKTILIDSEDEILGRWFIFKEDFKILLSNFNIDSNEYNKLYNQIKDNTIIELYEGYTKNQNPNGKLLIYFYDPKKNIILDFKETWEIKNNNLNVSNNYIKPIIFNNFDKKYFYFETLDKNIIRFYRSY